MEVEKVLNRKQYEYLLNDDNFKDLKDKFILITGAKGSIGTRLVERFKLMGVKYLSTDIDNLDITKESNVKDLLRLASFDIIINIAGAKHAPKGEIEVQKTLDINTNGVLNLLKHKGDAKLVLASTCKSCNPETVYGATKLISERLVMNNGGSVARFYNVVETAGNVFEIWEGKEAIEVAEICNRYFISLDEAVGLTMYAALNNGRYSVNTMQIHNMVDIANRIYPNKEKKIISPRQGDRVNELRHGTNELIEQVNESIIKVNNYFDNKF
jgi:FlaA1/EpsC-like NDP-sugar epimerase